MKIVFFPGVGFQNDLKKYEQFLNTIQREISFEYEVFNWMHGYLSENHDSDHNDLSENLSFKKTRSWFSEVILDFQHVLFHAEEMKIPEADLYMGHSAGSIIALAKAKGGHCVTFGSPVRLIQTGNHEKSSFIYSCQCKKTKVLNFIHKNDVIAYPIDKENTENYVFNSPFYSMSAYNPITAHSSYWTSREVVDKTTETLIKWGL